MTDAQLEQAYRLAQIETDLELAAITGEIDTEFKERLRIVLMRGQQLNMMR